MNSNSKILTAVLICLLFTCTNPTHGQEKTDTDLKNSKLKKEPIPKAYNPSASYAKKGYGPFVSGDFLWWKATQDDLQYAACLNEGKPLCDENFLLDSFKADVREPRFQYDPGFRIGLGYNLPRDGWDVFVQWTRLYSDAKDKCCAFPCETISSATCCPALAAGASCSTQKPCGKCQKCCPQDCDCCCEPCCPCCEVCFDCCCPTSITPTLCPIAFPDSFATTTVATADWKLRLNLLDGEIGRRFYTSQWLTLRPFFGVRGAWISQCYDVKYQEVSDFRVISFTEFEPSATIESTFDGCMICCSTFNSRFNGVGPRIGLNSEWMLGAGFGLYANAALSLIYGEFDFTQESNVSLCGDLTSTFTVQGFSNSLTKAIDDCARFELTDSYDSGKLITDLALGVQWQKSFAQDRVSLLLQIGYDHHLFLNQNPLIHLLQRNELDATVPFTIDMPNENGVLISQSNKYTELSDRRQGDLSLQGLTVSARLDF